MNIRLTANAGVLIEIDGLRILLDGVCEATEYYFGTPDDIKGELSKNLPDAVGFTHQHSDHYDESYANLYESKTLRPILGSECSRLRVGEVELTAISTRHLGKSDVPHFSFIIEGSRRIVFMGDASPSELTKLADYSSPYLIIVPFAYLNTEATFRKLKGFGAKNILAVHMPAPEHDSFGIWESVKNTTKEENILYFTKIGDTITLH